MQVNGLQNSAPASQSGGQHHNTFIIDSDCSSAGVFLGVSCPVLGRIFVWPPCSFPNLTACSASNNSCRFATVRTLCKSNPLSSNAPLFNASAEHGHEHVEKRHPWVLLLSQMASTLALMIQLDASLPKQEIQLHTLLLL
jgi:hypothetical protein